MQFVLRYPYKGIVSSMAVSLTNTMDCILLTVLSKCLNWWGHILSSLQPHSRAGKTCMDWAGVRLCIYSSIRYGVQWRLDVFTFESAEHLSSFILCSLPIPFSRPSPWCLSTAVYLTYHRCYGWSSAWATSVLSHYPPIIHSGSVWILLSAATVYSMHNREPSYLSPLLWLQASCGHWDQQEPDMKVLLQHLHKGSLPAVEWPRSPKQLHAHGQAETSGLSLCLLGLARLMVRTLLMEEERQFTIEDDSTHLP